MLCYTVVKQQRDNCRPLLSQPPAALPTPAGYVRTAMVGFEGLISPEESAAGMLGVLESGRELNGQWYDFAGKEIPW